MPPRSQISATGFTTWKGKVELHKAAAEVQSPVSSQACYIRAGVSELLNTKKFWFTIFHNRNPAKTATVEVMKYETNNISSLNQEYDEMNHKLNNS
jgi:hypothetical protein